MSDKPQVPGHRILSEDEKAAIARFKAGEVMLAEMLDEAAEELDADPRWLAIARTHFEQGTMALIRAVAKPQPMTSEEAVRILSGEDA